jgi:hypothetical protein
MWFSAISSNRFCASRDRWHHENAGMKKARFAEPAEVAEVVRDERSVLIDATA